MTHILHWMTWDDARVYHVPQDGTRFKSYELFMLFIELSIECGTQFTQTDKGKYVKVEQCKLCESRN